MSYDPVAARSPATAGYDENLIPPHAPGIRDSMDTPSNASFQSGHKAGSLYRDDPRSASGVLSEKSSDSVVTGYPPAGAQSGSQRKKRSPLFWILVGIATLALIVVAVVVPIYFKVIKKDDADGNSSSSTDGANHNGNSGNTGNGNGNGSGNNGGNQNTGNTDAIQTGADGSTITTEDGKTFTYKNSFGGYWAFDPNNPYYIGSRAQSWSPALNETWDFQRDTIRGVNLGGWLNTEPFISPALYEKYFDAPIRAIDEWTLSQNMANDPEGLAQLEEHYKTFITEEDFAMIAAAGLNWIRLPIPFWAIEKYPNEPFLEGVCWKYVLKAFAWARKYGLRINLDLHALPGSQSGFNHSGKHGAINFLNGVMGVANGQRALNHIRIITEFISQPEFTHVVPIFGVINEARISGIGMEQISGFYLEMHDMMRNITGYGAGNGAFIALHDGFVGQSEWNNFLPGHDRVSMDTHNYLCFADVDPRPITAQLQRPCTAWKARQTTSWNNFGVTSSGEFSLAINDCGLYLNGVGFGTRWEGTLATYNGQPGPDGPNGCDAWNDWENWDQERKDSLKQIAMASMDALQNWFFWTWKIGPSAASGKIESPLWSYRLGLENGWIPADPREAVGVCGANTANPLEPAMIGGTPDARISDATRAQFPWPPTTLLGPPSRVAADLPTYTATGTIPTLAMPTFIKSNGEAFTNQGNGWHSTNQSPIYVPIEGCNYPDQWDAINAEVPTCNAARKRVRGVKGVLLEPRAPASS